MKRAMVVSVGTGTGPDTDIVEPLVKSIGDSNPNYLVLLASDASHTHAEAVRSQLGLGNDTASVVRISDPDSVEVAFRESLAVIRDLMDRGFAANEITVDYTSGTKAMTAGLVLAATSCECAALKYITGKREHGRVVPGTERFLSISPAAVLAHQRLQLAQQFMLALEFDTALEVIERINPALLDERDLRLKEDLRYLARAYSHWDKFDHKRFMGEYGKISFQGRETQPFRLVRCHPARVLDIGKDIAAGRFSDDLLADLYNNAYRRFWQGKYDDCVARLYRVTEGLAQKALKERGIDTSDVQIELLPRDNAEWLSTKRSASGKVQLGLQDAYELLIRLDHPLGQAFKTNDGLRGCLQARNDSILAHGLKPVEETMAQGLLERVRSLAAVAINNFEQRCRDLQFPWIEREE
ncbi:MAG TPA: TIGR02710 family CRISPR-associated CARF protein [Alphaproteobacteria bacterium]|nr:TIGR02710 family CRISPR-associated CARF protein [Alphaproteobacteria bacterium]